MLDESRVPIRAKLAGLWASAMFLYVYGDYFGLFAAGRLAQMNRGQIPPLGDATKTVLVGVSLMMAVPSLMIFLSLVLPAAANRAANVVLGLAYSAIVGWTLMDADPFFLVLGVIEVALTLLVCIYAMRWPREARASEPN